VTEVGAILLGFAAGAVGGMLGVGGGILFVPALSLLLGQSHLDAEATSLLAIIPVAVVGAWRQHGYGNVRWRDGLAIGVLSAAGAVLGAVIANNIPERGLEVAFACLVLLVAAQLAWRALKSPQAPDPSRT
jgi:uncharacterized membrane protein YfcA